MADSPDFDRVAYEILSASIAARVEGSLINTGDIARIAAQLRQIWNARGAADIARLEAELTSMKDTTAGHRMVKTLDRALRTLDQ